MPALQPQPEIITLEQYNTLPENIRAEVFQGILYNMASPSQVHQDISRELLYALTDYIKKKNGSCKAYAAPFDVVLNHRPLTVVQPDLMVICDKNKLDGKRCNGAPDFIIEIVSPGNASDDYIKKLYYYQNHGVREYWIVNPLKKIVQTYFFDGEEDSNAFLFEDEISAHIFTGLSIKISDLL